MVGPGRDTGPTPRIFNPKFPTMEGKTMDSILVMRTEIFSLARQAYVYQDEQFPVAGEFRALIHLAESETYANKTLMWVEDERTGDWVSSNATQYGVDYRYRIQKINVVGM